MKTNTLKVILSTAIIGAISLMAIGKALAGNLMPNLAVTVSYLAISILVALAAVDYRGGSRSYLIR